MSYYLSAMSFYDEVKYLDHLRYERRLIIDGKRRYMNLPMNDIIWSAYNYH